MPVAGGQQPSDAMHQPRHRRLDEGNPPEERIDSEPPGDGSDDVAAKLREWRLENERLGAWTSGPEHLADEHDLPGESHTDRADQAPTTRLSAPTSADRRAESRTITSPSPDDGAGDSSEPHMGQHQPKDSIDVGSSRLRDSEPDAPVSAPAIEVKNLQKSFKDTLAVRDVSFSVPAGSIVALLGPNGAGKTTTVNMLCTLLKPDGGSATVNGYDVVADSAAVRRSIMLTGQFAALDESLTGRENLILFGRLLGLSKSAAKSRAAELLETFGLADAAGKRVGQYSGGMRRRIDIACGLVTSPKVVFLDEPTTGLDPRSRLEVWSLVGRLRDEGVTILLTTQYLEEADVLSDNIVVIDKGHVIAQGTSDALKEATGAAYCEVTPAHADDLPRMLEVLADLIPDGSAHSDDHAVSVPAPRGTETLVEVIRRTTDASIQLSDVAMRRPSLDEVFLALTDPEHGGR
ncbi:ATP-binding cassette domain-containing protein [Gordonia rubripertincta]|uniref:ATP-binding cassette domain-containing protein n=2 Tax=Gordonia rubripertincta TaxID=36822 RepID=A0AAW6RB39_GORRU|nr:ATP-binding cassette domain-containing protein [Gordonia rubripertincta]MDG6781848.1 ATP-binding cassette domain-containing protein [Gordonia rubripertincta]GAB83356.1 putative ABC transporter ATP-binding protein [Gordonia rubripertincta NBRC 101908]